MDSPMPLGEKVLADPNIPAAPSLKPLKPLDQNSGQLGLKSSENSVSQEEGPKGKMAGKSTAASFDKENLGDLDENGNP